MRKLYCVNPKCEKIIRSKEAFKPGTKCPDCGEPMLIHIKGYPLLQEKMPEGNYVTMAGHSTLPRRYRTTKRGGSAKNKYNP